MQDGNFGMWLESSRIEVSQSLDMAWSAGTYTASMTDPASGKRVREAGAFAVVYRRNADSLWKVAIDSRTRGGAPAEGQ